MSPDPAGHFIIVHLTVSGVLSAKGEFSHPDAKMKRSLGPHLGESLLKSLGLSFDSNKFWGPAIPRTEKSEQCQGI